MDWTLSNSMVHGLVNRTTSKDTFGDPTLVLGLITPGFYIYTLEKVLLPHIQHYHRDPTYSSLCNQTITSLGVYTTCASIKLCFHILTHQGSCTEWAVRDAPSRRRPKRLPRIHFTLCHRNSDQATSQSGLEYCTDTTDKAGNYLIH